MTDTTTTNVRPVVSIVLVLLSLVAAACGADSTTETTASGTATVPTTSAATTSDAPTTGGAVDLVLMTHDSFAVPEELLAAFRAETGISVQILRSGDAGGMLNQAILTKDNPLADVLFGVDNTFLSRALDAEIFQPYRSPRVDSVDPALVLDPEHRVTPVDFGDVCLNYDKQAFAELGVAPPASLEDLTDPAYRGLLVVESPATSSPGLAFLLATIAEYGEEGDRTWSEYWADLIANDTLVVASWDDAYYVEFSGGAGGGDRPLVVSYASSPPAEVMFAEQPVDEAPTGVIEAGCFRQIEFAGVLQGTEKSAAAEAFVDFMLGQSFQEAIPENMFVFPAVEGVELPAVFVENTVIPADPAGIDPASIEQNRERWIEEWTEVARG